MEKVIISGARRSGTHLLYRLLDEHGSLFNGLVEVYLLDYLYSLAPCSVDWFIDHFFEAPIDVLLDEIHERELLPVYRGNDIFPGNGIPATWSLEFDFDEIEFGKRIDMLRTIAPRSVEAIWDCWFDALASILNDNNSFPITVVKSPDYGRSILAAERFLKTFKALFIIRNPIATLNSMRKLRDNQPHRWELTTLRILEELENYRFLNETICGIEKRRPESIHVIRFEDLLNNTDETMRGVARFLGIEFSENLLRPTLRGDPWEGDSSFGPIKGVSRDALNNQGSLISSQEHDMVNRCLPDFLARYAYTVGETAAPVDVPE